MFTIREELELKYGPIPDKQFVLACDMATMDLTFHQNGIFTVKEFLEVTDRSFQIIQIRKIL